MKMTTLVLIFIFMTAAGMLALWTIYDTPIKTEVAKGQPYCTEARAKALEERVTALEEWAQRHGMKYK